MTTKRYLTTDLSDANPDAQVAFHRHLAGQAHVGLAIRRAQEHIFPGGAWPGAGEYLDPA